MAIPSLASPNCPALGKILFRSLTVDFRTPTSANGCTRVNMFAICQHLRRLLLIHTPQQPSPPSPHTHRTATTAQS